MKRILSFVVLSILGMANAFSQSAVIRGEVSAGVYENIKTDGAGKVQVSASISPAPGSSFTLTTPTITNASGQLLAANTSRKFLSLQNNHATGIVYVNFGATATTAHFKIPAGGTLVLDAGVPTNTVVAIGSVASNTSVVLIEGQ